MLLLSPQNAASILNKFSPEITRNCHIKNQEEQTGIASKKIFFTQLMNLLNQRLALFKKQSISNISAYNEAFTTKPLQPMIVLIDDTFDLLLPSKANTGLLLLKLLLAGHTAGIHCISASTLSFKNLLRQLVNIDLKTNSALQKFVINNQLNNLPPLGADMIITTDDFVFIKERQEADYKRLYNL